MSDYFLTFEVVGHPEPAGSKTNMPRRRFPVTLNSMRDFMAAFPLVDANKDSARWKKTVSSTAQGAMMKDRWKTIDGPCYVSLTFFVTRPKSHFRANGELSTEGRRHPFPAKKPDVLKLARGVEDALTDAGVYRDDALIVSERLMKQWGEREGVLVTVMPL